MNSSRKNPSEEKSARRHREGKHRERRSREGDHQEGHHQEGLAQLKEGAIGYDIDGVIANVKRSMLEKAREMGFGSQVPDSHKEWTTYDPEWGEGVLDHVWAEIKNDHEWWLQVRPYETAKIETEVACYITARTIPSEVTREWIRFNGFPDAPVHSIGPTGDKGRWARHKGLRYFVDDKTENVRAVQKRTGITGILMNRPHNRSPKSPNALQISSLHELSSIG